MDYLYGGAGGEPALGVQSGNQKTHERNISKAIYLLLHLSKFLPTPPDHEQSIVAR